MRVVSRSQGEEVFVARVREKKQFRFQGGLQRPWKPQKDGTMDSNLRYG